MNAHFRNRKTSEKKSRKISIFFLPLLLAASAMPGQSAAPAENSPEPNVQIASQWWPDPRGVWTPVGWKDHLFRFDVMYDGTILAAPSGMMVMPQRRRYIGNGFQLNFHPSADGALLPIPPDGEKVYKQNYEFSGHGLQGWREDKTAPVLWTDWPCPDGVVMRQEVFAHIPGASDIRTGIEPLFAWVRLSVKDVHPLHPPKQYAFGIQLSNNYYDVSSTREDSVFFSVDRKKIPLPQPLTSVTLPPNGQGKPGLVVRQGSQGTRMMVLPGGDADVTLESDSPTTGAYHMTVMFPARKGAHVDMLVAMLPVPADTMQAETALGFDGALEQADTYWKKKPATAAVIHTPEHYINEALKRNLQFAEIIAERNPDNGDYSFLSGSYGYDALWSTPTSMVSHMFLDLLGYFDVVERHIQIYREHQGTVKPPGAAYAMSPGYFSTPKTLTAIDWLSDHGAILEIISRHALMTGDKHFIDEWLGPILKGCDFIEDACTSDTGAGGVKGLMPPAVATDSGVPSQAVWIQAWNYKGLETSIELLKRIGNPRAAEFETFAARFKKTFDAAFRAGTAKQPRWTDSHGIQHPEPLSNLVPIKEHHYFDDAFLLDTGPMVLPWAGLFPADDPIMKEIEDFFRHGPNNTFRSPWTGPVTRAVLQHEISTCETCYSWNIVNSWKRGDRRLFLEGMYSLFTGGISPQTYINCEHRNAMYGNLFVAPLMTWCLRQAVVDDQLEENRLHLLRLCPLAWISSTEQTRFGNMPTIYGPIDLEWKLSEDGTSLNVSMKTHWRTAPKSIIMHIPPVPGLKQLVLNGKPHAASEGSFQVAE